MNVAPALVPAKKFCYLADQPQITRAPDSQQPSDDLLPFILLSPWLSELEQIGDRHSQCACKLFQRLDRRCTPSSFEQGNEVVAQAAFLGEHRLCDVPFTA